MIEPALEQLVREKVRRGTVQLSLRIDRPRRPEDYRINLVALSSYRDQLKGLRGFDETLLSTWAAAGLAGSRRRLSIARTVPDQDWPEIAEVVNEALAKLQAARAAEGRGDGRRADRAGRGLSTIN